MRLAIISDIHGNLIALEHVLDDLRRRTPDAVVNLGDCVTSPLWPRETFELLATHAMPTVRGNHDRWLAQMPPGETSASVRFTHEVLTPQQRTTLGDLPASLEIDDGILAVHGTPASDTEYLLEDAVDGRLALAPPARLAERLGPTRATLVLCGHSHHQHMACGGGLRVVLNPGSVGCPRSADKADPFGAEACAPHARYAVATRRAGRWSVELIALAYDWSHVVDRARQNNRPDWARGFLASVQGGPSSSD